MDARIIIDGLDGNESRYHSAEAAIADAKYILTSRPEIPYLRIARIVGHDKENGDELHLVCIVRHAFKTEWFKSESRTKATDNAPLAEDPRCA